MGERRPSVHRMFFFLFFHDGRFGEPYGLGLDKVTRSMVQLRMKHLHAIPRLLAFPRISNIGFSPRSRIISPKYAELRQKLTSYVVIIYSKLKPLVNLRQLSFQQPTPLRLRRNSSLGYWCKHSKVVNLRDVHRLILSLPKNETSPHPWFVDFAHYS